MSGFTSQFGLPISGDGKIVIVNVMYQGLYAYGTFTGEQLWKTRGGKFRHIFSVGDEFVVLRDSESLSKRRFSDGALIAELRNRYFVTAKGVDNRYVLIKNMTSGFCLGLVDMLSMQIVKQYAGEILNPRHCYSVIIQDAFTKENQLFISGVEDYPGGSGGTYDSKNPQRERFERVIDPQLYPNG
jgi:hypothetical protein